MHSLIFGPQNPPPRNHLRIIFNSLIGCFFIECTILQLRFLYGCYRCFDVFNCLGSKLAVRLLQFFTFLIKLNDQLLGVHKSINVAKPPNSEPQFCGLACIRKIDLTLLSGASSVIWRAFSFQNAHAPSAGGAADNSPQFQLRVSRAQ